MQKQNTSISSYNRDKHCYCIITFVANTAFAAPEETISSEENADTQNNISGNETELSEEELAAEYQAYFYIA